MLNVVHGLPGDDIFSSRPKMTPFVPRMRGNRGEKLEKLKRFPRNFGVPGEEICILAINRYTVMTFLEQLISWAASEISCVDNSD